MLDDNYSSSQVSLTKFVDRHFDGPPNSYQNSIAESDEEQFKLNFDANNALLDEYFKTTQTNEGEKFDPLAHIPSHLMPTVSSTLPPYLHGEIERIRNSYRSATYWTIKKLPNKIEPGLIQSVRKKQTVQNLLLSEKSNFKPASLLKDYAFHPHQHITMNYEKASNLNKQAVEEEKMRTDSYSRKPFVVSSRIRSRFEDIFDDPNFVFPSMGPSDKVDLASLGRSSNNNSASAPLLPSSFEGRLSLESSGEVRRWLLKFKQALERDWGDLKFVVKFTREQEVVVQFQVPYEREEGESRGEERGERGSRRDFPYLALGKYMAHLARQGLGRELGLVKRGDRWGVLEQTAPRRRGEEDTLTSPPVGESTQGGESRESQEGSSDRGAGAGGAGKREEGGEEGEGVRWFVPSSSTPFEPALPPKLRTPRAEDSPPQAQQPPPLAFPRSSLPFLTPMAEEREGQAEREEERGAEERGAEEAEGGSRGVEEERGEREVYLTFSLYAPWVSARQLKISKKIGERERAKAREYGERRQRLLHLPTPPPAPAPLESALSQAGPFQGGPRASGLGVQGQGPGPGLVGLRASFKLRSSFANVVAAAAVSGTGGRQSLGGMARAPSIGGAGMVRRESSGGRALSAVDLLHTRPPS